MDHLEIDGAAGEGGGQVLRTALSLSMATGRPFRIHGIRARRGRPGLLRQHLTAVQATSEVCGAAVTGASLGSTELSVEPGRARHGEHRFAVGTAGSAALVLQTVITGLLRVAGESLIVVEGGTDNPAAPPSDFLVQAWAPAVRALGVDLHVEVERRGYHPAGGGRLVATLRVPGALRPFSRLVRGATMERRAVARVSALPANIGHREVHTLRGALGLGRDELRVEEERAPRGPGNVVSVIWRSEGGVEVHTALGRDPDAAPLAAHPHPARAGAAVPSGAAGAHRGAGRPRPDPGASSMIRAAGETGLTRGARWLISPPLVWSRHARSDQAHL